MVYVISENGQPLMPTMRYGKVRRMLNTNKATVVKRCPFTIRLCYESAAHTQPISLGVDAGGKTVGLSATTETRVLYEAEVELRSDITKNLSARREFRRTRRSRKTRYRKPRFLNRTHAEHKGWLAPSVEAKIHTHLKVVDDVRRILPITSITAETASFDLQKLKADMEGRERPKGADYQKGEQLGFWNVREYVLYRDGHTCQCCKGKSKDPVLNVHHVESRRTGGDAPNNLVTLCETCHKAYHMGRIELPETIKRSASFKDAAFMGIMRWAFYDRLKKQCEPEGVSVRMTYGYITKSTRIRHGLVKTHCVDARCISGNPLAKPLGYYYHQKKVRCHNRQLHKAAILKGGCRKANQAPKYVFGYQLFDKVKCNGTECFVFGRRASGSFDIRTLDGTKISAGISYKKLRLLETRKSYLTERRAASSSCLKTGVSAA